MELKEKLTLEIKRNDDFQRRLIAEVVRADSLEKQLNAAIKCDSSYAGSESTYIEQNQKVNQNSYSHKGKYKTRISRQGRTNMYFGIFFKFKTRNKTQRFQTGFNEIPSNTMS